MLVTQRDIKFAHNYRNVREQKKGIFKGKIVVYASATALHRTISRFLQLYTPADLNNF